MDRLIFSMALKSATCFALVGMSLLTVVVALGFVSDISAFSAGAIAAMAMLVSLMYLLASPSINVFLDVVPQRAVLRLRF